MKRKTFVKQLGLGLPLGWINRQIFSDKILTPGGPFFTEITDLDDVKNEDGHVVLRIAFGSHEKHIRNHTGSIGAEGATIHKIKEYFFEAAQDSFNSGSQVWDVSTDPGGVDVLAVWLDGAKEESTVIVSAFENSYSFQLGDLLEKKQVDWSKDGVHISVNFLLYREIGEIDPAEIGFDDSGDTFRFAILADPQGGDPSEPTNESPTRMKIHNAFIEESIKITNSLDPAPLFTLVLGDYVDSKGQQANFRRMNELFKELKSPMLLEVGNHETAYNATFSPGYDMSALDNFFHAQKEVNGMEKILYSFNLGQWHFVVWPDPLRKTFWQTHPHYFDWLEQDLEKHKDRPTMFLQHVPIHPIGIDPLISYVETPVVKRMLLDILSRHGNVKYVLSGHVHIPIKSSEKTAVNYKGMKMINLPAAGYRPRAFGEEDYFGGPSQGVCYLDIEGQDVTITYQTVAHQTYAYPDELPELDLEQYSLWIQNKWEIPADKELINGDFKNGLEGWHRHYIYKEDDDPSQIREIREPAGFTGSALYLYARKRGYDKPGQDRLPQTLNHVCQAVRLSPDAVPVLQFKFKPDADHFHADTLNGAYVWLEGFQGSAKLLNLIYSVGYVTDSLTWPAGNPTTQTRHFDLPASPGRWHETRINIKKDFGDHFRGRKFEDMNLNRLVLNLGVWTVNDGHEQESGIYFGDVVFDQTVETESFESSVEGNPILPKKEENIWNPRIDHIAGEHQYASQEMLYSKIH